MYPRNERDRRDSEDVEDSVPAVPSTDIPAAPGRDTGIGRTEDVSGPPNTDEIDPPGERRRTPGTADTDDGEEPVPEPPD
jgi:hypothetical protein